MQLVSSLHFPFVYQPTDMKKRRQSTSHTLLMHAFQNRHLDLVSNVLQSFSLTFYEVDTTSEDLGFTLFERR